MLLMVRLIIESVSLGNPILVGIDMSFRMKRPCLESQSVKMIEILVGMSIHIRVKTEVAALLVPSL